MSDERPEPAPAATATPKMDSFQSGAHLTAIIPRNLGEVAMCAAAIIRAGLAPDSYTIEPKDAEGRNEGEKITNAANKTKARIMIGIMKGAEVGFPPITALSTIAIIANRPCIYGDGAMALVHQSRVLARYEEFWEGPGEKATGPTATDNGEEDFTPTLRDFDDGLTAVVRMWRNDHSAPYEGRYSVRDAKRAHLWGNSKKKPWIENPKRMLRIRARSFALRDGFADKLMGLSIHEEMEDLTPAIDHKTDTSFLDDGPKQLAPPESPAMPMNAQEIPSGVVQPRSAIWELESFQLDEKRDGAGELDANAMSFDLCFLIEEATSDELTKLFADNAGLIGRLDEASRAAIHDAMTARLAVLTEGAPAT